MLPNRLFASNMGFYFLLSLGYFCLKGQGQCRRVDIKSYYTSILGFKEEVAHEKLASLLANFKWYWVWKNPLMKRMMVACHTVFGTKSWFHIRFNSISGPILIHHAKVIQVMKPGNPSFAKLGNSWRRMKSFDSISMDGIVRTRSLMLSSYCSVSQFHINSLLCQLSFHFKFRLLLLSFEFRYVETAFAQNVSDLPTRYLPPGTVKMLFYEFNLTNKSVSFLCFGSTFMWWMMHRTMTMTIFTVSSEDFFFVATGTS